MQVLKCTHKFITTDDEEVCTQCGHVQTKFADELGFDEKTYTLNEHFTPIPRRFLFPQRYVDQKFMPSSLRRIDHLIDMFCNELGITHAGLRIATMEMYKIPRNKNLMRGLNLAVTVAACLYITAQKIQITITLAQLADIIIKNDMIPGRAKGRKAIRRHVRMFIYRLVTKCMVNNDIKQTISDIHPVIVMMSQVGARAQYRQVVIRHCINVFNTIIAQDVNAFAGRKPSMSAATLVFIFNNGARGTMALCKDFKVSDVQLRNNLIRFRALLTKHGIKYP
jgi:transcription initiation factor TFIIIB Brf1 subunit/transcription initiation factor TFIIB